MVLPRSAATASLHARERQLKHEFRRVRVQLFRSKDEAAKLQSQADIIAVGWAMGIRMPGC
jgi:hypothetical protein